MGMGYSACFTYAVNKDVVRDYSVNGDGENTYDKLMNLLFQYNITEGDLYYYFEGLSEDELEIAIYESGVEDDNEIKEIINDIEHCATEILELFKDKTNISIYFAYHDQEEKGSRYDSVNGLFFEADFGDLFERTEAFEKMEEHIGTVSYVEFG